MPKIQGMNKKMLFKNKKKFRTVSLRFTARIGIKQRWISINNIWETSLFQFHSRNSIWEGLYSFFQINKHFIPLISKSLASIKDLINKTIFIIRDMKISKKGKAYRVSGSKMIKSWEIVQVYINPGIFSKILKQSTAYSIKKPQFTIKFN